MSARLTAAAAAAVLTIGPMAVPAAAAPDIRLLGGERSLLLVSDDSFSATQIGALAVRYPH